MRINNQKIYYFYWLKIKDFFKLSNLKSIFTGSPIFILVCTIVFQVVNTFFVESSNRDNIRLMLATEIKSNKMVLSTAGSKIEALDQFSICVPLPSDREEKTQGLITVSSYLNNEVYTAYLDKISVLNTSETEAIVKYYNAIKRLKTIAYVITNKSSKEKISPFSEIDLMEKEFRNLYSQSSDLYDLLRANNPKIPRF